MTSFSDLGATFPLFDAAVEETGWETKGRCAVCGNDRGGFALGAGSYLLTECTSCGRPAFAPTDGDSDDCGVCGSPVMVGEVDAESVGCVSCLASGQWALTQDTEAGMVTPALAMRGRTHGIPTVFGSSRSVVTPISVALNGDAEVADDNGEPPAGEAAIAGWAALPPNEDGWQQAVIPSDILMTLVTTPSYSTWQGESWMFHCERVMVYIGRWTKSDFDEAAPDGDGKSLAAQVAGIDADWWPSVADDLDEPSINTYMFRCSVCDALRGHWDMD